MEKKKRLKTIGYEEIEFLIEWNCPYCKKTNQDGGDYVEENEILACRFCKKKCKVLEPD